MTMGSSPRLYQRVFDILADLIGRGVLAPGAVLTETGVAARFGISRAPARQALDELVSRGLIARTPRRGFVVAGGSPAAAAPPAAAVAEPEVTPLVQRPSWERILGEVEAEIIARSAFAAWRVNEAEIARHYGVSRTVARDVIGRLQQSGVVRKDARSHWFAPALTPQHVGELYELRWILEPVALRKAAPNLPPAFVPELRRNVLRAIEGPGPVAAATLDALENDLHVRLLEHCGNPLLMQAILGPQSLLIVHRFLYRWTAELFETEPFLREHLDILDRLAAGHVEDAAAMLEHHLRVSLDRALARIDLITRGTQPEPLSYLDRLPPEP